MKGGVLAMITASEVTVIPEAGVAEVMTSEEGVRVVTIVEGVEVVTPDTGVEVVIPACLVVARRGDLAQVSHPYQQEEYEYLHVVQVGAPILAIHHHTLLA
jgi:hypothetical protein